MLFFILQRNKNSPAIRDAPGFDEFLAARGSYVTQRCTIEYCRLKAGMNWDALLHEQPFADALERCRWIAYAAVTSDLALLLEGALRPHAADDLPALGRRIAQSYEDALVRYDPPGHDPGLWRREIATFAPRLARAQMAAPQKAGDCGREAGTRIFEVLPIHKRVSGHDLPLIQNNVRFAMVRAHEDLPRIMDLPATARALVADAPAAANPTI